MTLPKDPIRQWLIGVLLVIVSSLSSIAYASVTSRIADLENDRKSAVLDLATVKLQLAVLQETVGSAKTTLLHVESQQDETLAQLTLLLSSSRSAAKWREQSGIQGAADSRRWNSAMDKLPKPRP